MTSDDDESAWLCDQCFPDSTVVGNVGPWVRVVAGSAGVWLMSLRYPAHLGDALVHIDPPPTRNPLPDELEREIEDLPDSEPRLIGLRAAFDSWFDRVGEAMDALIVPEMGLDYHWRMVDDLMAGGYSIRDDPPVEVWLFDQVGKVLAEGREPGNPASG